MYVKAGLTSEFRQQFALPKSRAVNDLHHAKDAYLNIVTGNVWHCKYSRQFWRAEEENNAKVEVVFTHEVRCGGKTIWAGAADKDRVVRIAQKNTAHLTKYAFCRKGGLFDQMPLPKGEGLTPRKKDLPTNKYGGYNKATASFFVLVRYSIKEKKATVQNVMVMPVDLLIVDRFMQDEQFALDYARDTIGKIVNKPGDAIEAVEFLLNKRQIKVNTVLSLNGLRMCITGKGNGGKIILVSPLTPFKTSAENEAYIKRLESFARKKEENSNLVFSEKYDKITAEKNIALYNHYIDKLQAAPYKYRPANPVETLVQGKDTFVQLSPPEQATVLLAIQGLFGRAVNADLHEIGGAKNAGKATLSTSLSNWKKSYTDVRIVDTSASGLYETVSENLLTLL